MNMIIAPIIRRMSQNIMIILIAICKAALNGHLLDYQEQNASRDAGFQARIGRRKGTA